MFIFFILYAQNNYTILFTDTQIHAVSNRSFLICNTEIFFLHIMNNKYDLHVLHMLS